MKFGQYELLERVAVGGMAEVYRGRVAGAEGFEKWVAIKRILPEYAQDDRFISMMLTEARIHSALSHRNIVQIHDLGISEDGEYFIVLEYVEGHDLRAVMETATELGVQIPDALALHIAGELAQALHFAHELKDPEGQPLGIIHRDVSPSNVLISNSGEVKLSDFGIAKRRHEHSVVGSLKGNLAYMSPEQARRVPLDRRTDVFSLGAVLFEMLTGQKLRAITDEVNGFREVASGVLRPARALRPDLPDAYDALLARALASDPAQRFADAAELGAAIRELRRESEAPVGPADMKELLELIAPPRRARNPVERSKVIRLGPEFRVLAGATKGTRGGIGPDAPMNPDGFEPTPSLAPGVVPAPQAAASQTGNGNGNGNGGRAWADTAARFVAATPPPAPPVSPAMTTTPPPPVVAPVPKVQPSVRKMSPAEFARSLDPLRAHAPAAPAPVTPPPPPIAEPAPAGVDGAALAEAALYPATPAPVPPPGSGSGGSPSNANLPADGMQEHSGAIDALAPAPDDAGPVTPPPESPRGPAADSTWPAPSGDVQLPAPGIRSQPMHGFQEQFASGIGASGSVLAASPKRRGRPGLSFTVALLSVLGAGAAVVNYKVVPLDVLVTWPRPASLAISSDPSGADVKLDGRALLSTTPTQVDVRRDFQDHVLELSHAGSHSVRTTIRFDRNVALSEAVSLPALPPPPPPPPPVAAEAPPPVPQPPKVAVAEIARPTTKAEMRATKKAAKAATKLAKKKSKKKKSRKAATQRNGEPAETADL